MEKKKIGNWLFITAIVIGILGLLAFWVSPLMENRTPYRKIAITLAAVAIPTLLLSYIYRLPIKPRTQKIGLIGALISLIGAILMHIYFRELWILDELDMEIISIYGIGLIILALAGLVLPILRDKEIIIEPQEQESKEMNTRPQGSTEKFTEPKESKATFELYEDKKDEWRWRLKHRNGNIIADGGEGYSSKQKAKQGINSVKENAKTAEVEEKT